MIRTFTAASITALITLCSIAGATSVTLTTGTPYTTTAKTITQFGTASQSDIYCQIWNLSGSAIYAKKGTTDAYGTGDGAFYLPPNGKAIIPFKTGDKVFVAPIGDTKSIRYSAVASTTNSLQFAD